MSNRLSPTRRLLLNPPAEVWLAAKAATWAEIQCWLVRAAERGCDTTSATLTSLAKTAFQREQEAKQAFFKAGVS